MSRSVCQRYGRVSSVAPELKKVDVIERARKDRAGHTGDASEDKCGGITVSEVVPARLFENGARVRARKEE